MRPAAGELDQPYPLSLEVLPQPVVVALSHHDCGRDRVDGAVVVAAGRESFPIDHDMFSDGLFPFPEILLVAGNP